MSQKIKTSVEIDGSLSASQIANATIDTDKFLVSDGGVIKYRTGAELATDLGVSAGTTSKVQHQVKAGVAINKGQAVYVTGADGTNMIVGLASNATEATSSKTMGLLNATVNINDFADVITEGLLDGLDTSSAVAGNPVWLGTGGNLIYGLANKPYAPSHLVFIGIVTRVNANNGEIFVKVQNGFELDEIHDVDLKTTAPINGHLLGFNGTLWVNKTIAGWLGYTPQAQLNGTGFVKASGTTITYDNTSYYPASNPNGYISTYTETDTLASVTGRGSSTSTLSSFNGGLTATKTAKNAYAIQVKGGLYGAPRLQLYDLAVDNNAFVGLGVDMSGAAYEFSNYFPRTGGNGKWSVGSWAGDFGTGQYVSGYNEKLWVNESSAQFNVSLTGTADMRSPIFYDSNDTSYYTNPASTSVLSSVVLRGASAISFYGAGSGTYNIGSIYSSTSINSWEAPLETDSYTAARVPFILTWRGGYAAKGGLKLIGDASAELGGNVVLHSGNISSYAVPQTRTITINGTSYDLSANRSWTVTASETDTLATVVSRGDITNGGRPIRLDTSGGGVSIRGSVGGWATGYYFMGSSNTYRGGFGALGDADGLSNYWIGPAYNNFYTYIDASQITHTSSMRAPIFYDSNNTGYYIDPASTSNMNAISAGGYIFSGNYIESAGAIYGTIFYDNNDRSYYCDPNSTSRLYQVNAPQGYISNGNPWGTANSAYFPNGITTAGSDNWIYGHTYIGNAPANGAGHEFWGSGKEYHRSSEATTSQGASGRWLSIQSANGNFIPYSFESEYGNHSWGTVARFRINQSAADRPSIQFSSASSDNRWNIGYCAADDNFRIVQNMGYRNDNSTSDGWGTERLLINTDGNIYSNGLYQSNTSLRAPIFYDSNDTSYYVDPHSTSYQRSLFLGAHDSGSSEFRFGEDSSGWYGDRWYWDSGYNIYRYSRYAGTDALIHYHDTRDTSRITYGRNIVFDDYGKGIVGTYTSTRYQGVFAMGDSYKLPADGSSPSNLYGLAWSHPNAGGVAGNLNTHGLLAMENGTWLASLTGSTRARDDMRAPIFYDNNNTGYYVDPNSTTKLNALTLSSLASDDGMIENNTGGYFHLGGWGVGRTAATAVLVNTAYRSDYADTATNSDTVDGYHADTFYRNIGFGSGYPSWNLDTVDPDRSGFTYGNAAPYTGPFIHIGASGYGLQLNAPYGGNGYGLSFRTRNGDAGSWNSWRYPAIYGVNANGGGELFATRYYDQNDTTYYCDPSDMTNLKFLQVNRPSNGQSGTRLLGGQGTSYGAITLDVDISNYGTGIKINNQSSSYANSAMAFFYNGSQCGGVSIGVNSTAYNTSSDYRLKENVVPIESPIVRLKELNPCRFNFINEPSKTVDGFIAHEVQEIIPEAVTGVKDELDYDGSPKYQGIDQSKIVPLLTAALQEAIEKINSLEQRIIALENN